jgi:hypothetical protein
MSLWLTVWSKVLSKIWLNANAPTHTHMQTILHVALAHGGSVCEAETPAWPAPAAGAGLPTAAAGRAPEVGVPPPARAV